MSKAFVSTARLSLVISAIGFAFCILIGRLFYLHVWQHAELLEHVQNNRRMVQVIKARRGDIVDSKGNLLATMHTRIDLGVDPQVVREEDRSRLAELAELIGQPLAKIEEAFDTKIRKSDESGKAVNMIRWASLAKDLDEETYEAVQQLNIKGVYGNRKYSRTYPGGTLAAHVLGYVNHEEVPVTGVERYFDYYLRGQDGWRETERDGRRRELAQFRERQVEPFNGLNIALTIDQMVQHIVEEEIENLVGEYDPESVSVIVSEPATGAILAMANYPTYDPNEFFNIRKYPMEFQRNRALTDVMEPGSTFKIVPTAAVLNEGIVDLNEIFQTGYDRVNYKGRSLKLPSDHHEYEQLSLYEIVVKSSNRGAAHLGLRLGEQRLYDYAHSFGFGEKTGFDLGGEVSGTLHSVNSWDGLTITRLPMGHAVSATPMQIHSAMSVIANKGILMEPLIARQVYDDKGNEVITFMPKAKRRVIAAEVAETVAEMLVDVVGINGTAQRAAIENYAIAGKTGTTQKIIDGHYSREHHVASFSGFFPADKPALVITVVVNDPKLNGIGYGGVVAAPAFRNIAETCIGYMGIRPANSKPSFFVSNYPQQNGQSRVSN
jgi:cell division protein FtsI/penicillin-binding protein 2